MLMKSGAGAQQKGHRGGKELRILSSCNLHVNRWLGELSNAAGWQLGGS